MKKLNIKLRGITSLIFSLLFFSLTTSLIGQNHPNGIDFIGPDGVVYPDFTFAGYHAGKDPIPNVPVVATVRQNTGNDRQAILDAISYAVSQGGGAVRIPAGSYTISDGIRITNSNIVIRGDGIGSTIINITRAGASSTTAVFRFEGGRPGHKTILEDFTAQRGDTVLNLPARDGDTQRFLSRVSVGDWIELHSYLLPEDVAGRFNSDVIGPHHNPSEQGYGPGSGRAYAANIMQIKAINGTSITIGQPLRAFHSWTEFAECKGFVQECGIENMTISFEQGMYNDGKRMNGFQHSWAVNCWAQKIQVIETAQSGFGNEHTKHVTIQDCMFDGTQEKDAGGGVAYLGFSESHDNILQRCTGNEQRHAPNFQVQASGNVFRNLNFESSNIDSHSGFPRYNLVEQCSINRLNSHLNSYWSSPLHDNYFGRAPAGDGDVIFNCDIDGGRTGAGFILGGLQRGFVAAYNRVLTPGYFQTPSEYYPADDIIVGDFCDATFVGNVFCNEDNGAGLLGPGSGGHPVWFRAGFVIGQGQSGGNEEDRRLFVKQAPYRFPVWAPVPNTSKVHLINNEFYGHDPSRRNAGGYGRLTTDQGNSYEATFDPNNLPARPSPPMGQSLYEWQMQQKSSSAGERSGTFPVEFIDFRAQLNSQTQNVDLEWSTASELNNDLFILERSVDSRSFESIGQVPGAGNSNTIRSYSFTDREAQMGPNFYRLRQVDYDGSFEYSSIVSINVQEGEVNSLWVYPSPTKIGEAITVEFILPQSQLGVVKISNQLGQILYKEKVETGQAGVITIPTHDLHPGIYFIQVYDLDTEDIQVTQKLQII